MAKDAKNKNEKKHFFKDFKAELKKVIWPTPKQLVNNTVAVITIVLITAAIVFVLDFVFERMNTYGINKIKEAVESRNEISNEVENEETIENEVEETQTEEELEATEGTEQVTEQEETKQEILQDETTEQAE